MGAGLPPNVDDSTHDWAAQFSNFPDAWALSPPTHTLTDNTTTTGEQKGKDIVIAHPDTGYTKHSALPVDLRYFTAHTLAKNFLNPDYIAEDQLLPSLKVVFYPSHGTSTASVAICGIDSTISGSSTPSVTGVAPEASIIPFLVTESVFLTSKSYAALADCIYHNIKRNMGDGVDTAVMSISLGSPVKSRVVATALQKAREEGIIVIAAAAQLMENKEKIPVAFPGNDPNTVCVGACDYKGKKLSTGFYGPEIDITAPGVNVWKATSLWRKLDTPKYIINQGKGTSYATAITAGACALWLAYHGRAFLIDKYGKSNLFCAFLHCLQQSADTSHPGWVADPNNRGAGILDAKALLQTSLPSRSTVETLCQNRFDNN